MRRAIGIALLVLVGSVCPISAQSYYINPDGGGLSAAIGSGGSEYGAGLVYGLAAALDSGLDAWLTHTAPTGGTTRSATAGGVSVYFLPRTLRSALFAGIQAGYDDSAEGPRILASIGRRIDPRVAGSPTLHVAIGAQAGDFRGTVAVGYRIGKPNGSFHVFAELQGGYAIGGGVAHAVIGIALSD